ncbi:MAG: DEAD/DEAH box helicase [Mediterranea sp.]|jgi:ERCC4-related helicase|nr:DEAD/DEAH box helicase [Mediterranea sp.]
MEKSVNGKKGRKKVKKPVGEKVSYTYKPDNMTLEEWQIALRRDAAEKGTFGISEVSRKEQPGYYKVDSPNSHNEYRVVFRGKDNPWNYCSCMDFKTSQLGTCKHIEAVALWLKAHHKGVCKAVPPYTSVYLSYRGEREVRLRIGTDNADEFRELAKPYFTPEGVMRPEAVTAISDFLRDALKLNDTFRCYSDALGFILEKRDGRRREQMLPTWASDGELDRLLKAKLYPYQKEGIRFAFRAGKSIIADEMGLGKTIQAIGTAELMRKRKLISSALILCPTSLKYQWKKEIERFTDADAIVVEGNHLVRRKLYEDEAFYKIVSYNSACNDIKIMRSLYTDFLIMDEVQRLKNWNTQISKAARHIESEYSVVLSGTPLENKLEELYSIMQFVDQYCLGPYYRFMDKTVVRSDTGKVISYQNLNAIGEQMKDVLIRRRKRDVALQLPERMDKVLFVPMTKEQMTMHEECATSVSQLVTKWTRTRFLSEKDRKRLLLLLSQMRMLCDSTYILDQKSRNDTKVEETMNILRNVFESGDEKVVIFSQWERMTRLIARELEAMGVRYENLNGSVPAAARKKLMDDFCELPESRVFLSTDAGSTGLNLQVASIVINLDLPWNPAVLEQRIARIYRIGQKRNIQVINLVAKDTIEERMLSTLNFKSSLFEGILDNGEDAIFLENSKLDKIMESIQVMTTVGEEGVSSPVDSGLAPGEQEEVVTREEGMAGAFVGEPDEPSMPDTAEPHVVAEPEPSELLQQGFSFLSGLARTLSSPEATRKLVDELVEEDKETGRTTLRIPVPDKESVSGVLNLIGKLLSQS